MEGGWEHKIDLTPPYEEAAEDDSKIPALCALIIGKLEILKRLEKFYDNPDLDDYIIDFQAMEKDAGTFDLVMESFYDWAEDNKLWIKTKSSCDERVVKEIVFVAKNETIGQLVLDCADGKITFDALCEQIAALGFKTTSLHEWVSSLEKGKSDER